MPSILKVSAENLSPNIHYNRLKDLEKVKGGHAALEILYKIGKPMSSINIEDFTHSLLKMHSICVIKDERERIYRLKDESLIMDCLQKVNNVIKVRSPIERLSSARRVLSFG